LRHPDNAQKEAKEFATKLIDIQLSFINTDVSFGLAELERIEGMKVSSSLVLPSSRWR
jgi:hypothetical protein